MTIIEYKNIIFSDLHRYNPNENQFLRFFLTVPGFQYSFWMRTARFLSDKKGFVIFILYILTRYFLRRCMYKYQINIPFRTQIEKGLYIGHFGGIVVSPESRIGKNVNVNHGVTIGSTFGGKFPGSPTIGNNVYLGPGSKIIGRITIGHNVSIGANCVVVESIPDGSVVVGVPGRIISNKSSKNYVINTV